MTNIDLPKIIKCNRSKKFTQKQSPYKTYLQAKWKWVDIFSEIDAIKHTNPSYLKIISSKYGITYNTLSNKYSKYTRSKELNNEYLNNENRGGSNKSFDIDDEAALYNHIKINFIDKDTPLTNSIIKEIAIQKYKSKNDNINDFKASDGWCTIFKKRWNLSSQNVKPKRIATNILSDQDINDFLLKYADLTKMKKKEYI